MYSCFFVSLSKESPLDKRLLALPEMDVSGVLKSCEIARSRFARNCSFFARIAASCFSRAFSHFQARAHSPRMDSRILFSNGSTRCFPHHDSNNSIYHTVAANSKVQTFCIGKRSCCSSGTFIVFQYPAGNGLFIFGNTRFQNFLQLQKKYAAYPTLLHQLNKKRYLFLKSLMS